MKFFLILITFLVITPITGEASFSPNSLLSLRSGYSQHTLSNPGNIDSIYRGLTFGADYGRPLYKGVMDAFYCSAGIDYSLLENVEDQGNQDEKGTLLSARIDLAYKMLSWGLGMGVFGKYNILDLEATGVIDNEVKYKFYSYGLYAEHISQNRFFNYGFRLSYEMATIDKKETALNTNTEYTNTTGLLFISFSTP